MDRTLRVLAIIALVFLGLFLVVARLFDAVQQPAYGDSEGALLPTLIPGILVNMVGQTAFTFCLGVGVAALVACLQRRQWGWAVGLLALLTVVANTPTLAVELAPLVDSPQYLASAPYVGLLSDTLIPLAVLAYVILPHPSTPPAIQTMPALE